MQNEITEFQKRVQVFLANANVQRYPLLTSGIRPIET